MTDPRSGAIAVLAPFPPSSSGLHGGARAVAQLICGLAEQRNVMLAYVRSGADDPPGDAVLAACVEFLELPRAVLKSGPVPASVRRLQLAGGLLRGRPMWSTDYRPTPASMQSFRAAIQRWNPGVLQVEYSVMVQYADLAPSGLCRVLTEHDPPARAAEERAQRARGIQRIVQSADAHAWRRYQAHVLASVDVAVTFTERDRASLEHSATRTTLRVIPLAPPLPGRSPHPLGSEPHSVVFVGNFLHPANRFAAEWLWRDIWPRIRAQVPDACLYLVGDDLAATLRSAGIVTDARCGVTVTGRVPDMDAVLDRAGVVVAPLTTGGGMRVKVIEAMAAGKALVATRRAVEGLSVQHDREVLLADDALTIATAVTRLLRDASLRGRVATAARLWAETELRPDRRISAYLAVYDALNRRQR